MEKSPWHVCLVQIDDEEYEKTLKEIMRSIADNDNQPLEIPKED